IRKKSLNEASLLETSGYIESVKLTSLMPFRNYAVSTVHAGILVKNHLRNIPGKPPPILPIIFENLPIFIIICCISPNLFSIVFSSVTLTPLPLAMRTRCLKFRLLGDIRTHADKAPRNAARRLPRKTVQGRVAGRRGPSQPDALNL